MTKALGQIKIIGLIRPTITADFILSYFR